MAAPSVGSLSKVILARTSNNQVPVRHDLSAFFLFVVFFFVKALLSLKLPTGVV